MHTNGEIDGITIPSWPHLRRLSWAGENDLTWLCDYLQSYVVEPRPQRSLVVRLHARSFSSHEIQRLKEFVWLEDVDDGEGLITKEFGF